MDPLCQILNTPLQRCFSKLLVEFLVGPKRFFNIENVQKKEENVKNAKKRSKSVKTARNCRNVAKMLSRRRRENRGLAETLAAKMLSRP